MATLENGKNVIESSRRGNSFEFQSKDLPSRRLLGKGLSGIGYETAWKGARYARKDFVGVQRDVFLQEAAVLVGLKDHKNLVKTYGWTIDKRSCSLVLEYMDEDLLSLLQKRMDSKRGVVGKDLGKQSSTSTSTQPVDLPEAVDMMLQIATGVEYLHEQGLAHGDLKTKNILVTHRKDGDRSWKVLKLSDFGLVGTKRKSRYIVSRTVRKLDMVRWKAPECLKILSRRLHSSNGDEDGTSSESESESIPGSVPEMSSACAGIKSSDVYSFAVICSQILTGHSPYPDLAWKELMVKILSGCRPDLPVSCHPLLRELLISCWVDPAERPSFSTVRMKLIQVQELLTAAMEKRPQEVTAPSLADSPAHQAAVIPSTELSRSFGNCLSLKPSKGSTIVPSQWTASVATMRSNTPGVPLAASSGPSPPAIPAASPAADASNKMNGSSSSNAQQRDPYSNPSSQASSSEADDHERRQGVTRALDDLNASDTSHTSHTTSSSHGSYQDNPDETGRKTLGSYYLKTAIRMLTDYIADLKISNEAIDDPVKSRIEEYDALLHELKEKEKQQESPQESDDSKSLLATQYRGKLISVLLDYQAVLLSEALSDPPHLNEDIPDHGASYAQGTEVTELRTPNEVGEDSGARRVPVYLSDTDFQEGGFKEPLTGSLALCEKEVHKFESLLPRVIIFKRLCTYVVSSLAPRAQLNFVRYRKILSHLDEVEGGSEISSSLRNSASFCFESLVGLARRFHSVADLLTKCGSPDWHKSALELANVRPSRHKLRWSEFSLAIRNCQWSMDLVELAFHALQKLQEEGRYSVKDATFKWSEEKGRMVLQILPDRELDRQNSVNQESSKLQEVCRDLEEKDLTDLIERLEMLMVSEKEKKPFYRGTSSAYEIAKYLSNKLSGPTPVAGCYLPYTFSKIESPSLKYREYLDIGSSGMVATHDWHKVQVVVKSARCPIRARFEEEAAILGMVQHPNVVRLIGCGYIDKSDTGLLVMELMDHDLRYIIDSRLKILPEGSNPFAPIVAIDIMLQIGQAMLYLREHGILHRNLKAKNVLVNLCKPLALQEEADSANTSLMRQSPAVSTVLPHTQENYVAKLADFGLAKCRPQSSYVNTTMFGTTGWTAPEVFNSTENEAYKWPADVYSFGMLCYEILTGKMPFEEEPDHGVGLHAKIMAGVRPPLDSLLRPDVPDALRELIQQCWATNAAERPSFEAIVKKLWECKVQAILHGFERQIMRTGSSTVIT